MVHRGIVGAVTAAVSAGLLCSAPLSALGAGFTPGGPTERNAAWKELQCGPASSAPVTDGRPVTVDLGRTSLTVGRTSATTWARPASTDPMWRMQFYSLGWLRPVAKRAFDDGQEQALRQVTDQVTAFYVQNPDRNTTTLGWDEGTSLRRLEALNCLYALTSDRGLAAGMAREVNVLTGWRYYGPPRHPVHNHGLMANLQIARAADLLGRSDWTQRARTRIVSESRVAFTAKGTSLEQSAAYHLVNRALWLAAARRLEQITPNDPAAHQIRTRMAAAEQVGRWLTEPDGNVVQIGDSRLVSGLRPTGRERGSTFRDDTAGVAVGRWSWTGPDTTYYTLRYGPARFAHGHHDKSSVTWSAGGERVLVGPGYYSYDWSNAYALRARSARAHNAAWVPGRSANARATATLRAGTTTRDVHRFTLSDSVYGLKHSRSVEVAGPARRLVVKDVYPGRTAVRQSWHLDPAWQARGVRGKVATYAHPDGRILSIATTGSFVSATRGATRPPSGWNHPTTGSRVANWEIVTGGAGAVTTTFQVK